MAKKIKRVSVNELEKAMQVEACELEAAYHGVTYTIRRRISVGEMLQFTRDVVEPCFMDDGTYLPEIQGFAFRCALLEYYTNIRLPQDLDKRAEIVYGTDIVGGVMRGASADQIEELRLAVETKIDHMLNTDITYTRNKLNEAIEALTRSQAQMADVVSGLDAETVNGALKALSGGQLDEEKVVQAIVQHLQPDDNEEEPE